MKIVQFLRNTIQQCSARGLLDTSKFLSEQLVGIAPSLAQTEIPAGVFAELPQPDYSTESLIIEDKLLLAKSLFDLKEYLRCAFELKVVCDSYIRKQQKASAANSNPSKTSNSQPSTYFDELIMKVFFLRLFSLYLAGEKRREEELLEKMGVVDSISIRENFYNRQAKYIVAQCKQLEIKDCFIWYIYGLGLREIGQSENSTICFIKSISMNPFLWCSWIELSNDVIKMSKIPKNELMNKQSLDTSLNDDNFNLMNTVKFSSLPNSATSPAPPASKYQKMSQTVKDALTSSLDPAAAARNQDVSLESILSAVLPEEIINNITNTFARTNNAIAFMNCFFLGHTLLEMHNSGDSALRQYKALMQDNMFPKSSYVRSQVAVSLYQTKQFDKAQYFFEKLYEKDQPFRLENLDTFSNILYVKQDRSKLSFLAQHCHTVEKYRPETCCVIGNYYSIRGDHEKSVLYFRRALKLDRKYLSAWTLMGHEYLQLKNTAAAIYAYRTAVDINSNDYRALYGLGQTYEILGMHLYALFYYSKATMLTQYDYRMWMALANCYEALQKKDDAKKCYKRASLLKGGADSVAVAKLQELSQQQQIIRNSNGNASDGASDGSSNNANFEVNGSQT